MAERQLDEIRIVDLMLRCIIGVNDEERTHRQDVVINTTLYADLRTAGQSDRIEDTIDYKALKRRIVDLVESSRFQLIEVLGEAVAKICLADLRVRKVRVRIEKPGALRFARSVWVEMVREQDDESSSPNF